MSTLAIEIHDAGILVSGDGYAAAQLPAASPGYALIADGRTVTGAAAAAAARLKPKQINSRFWSDVDAMQPPSSSPSPSSPTLTHADLAHAHLSAIWEGVRGDVLGGGGDAEVLLVIPGSYSDPQLGLVLGITRACGMPVTGMVDAALAAAMGSFEAAGEESLAPAVSEKHLLHLDLQLHKSVLTELVRGADEVVRRRVEVLRQPGLESLRETWLRRIAEAFVRQTRLDPFHAGETEQRLYDSLPALMQELSGVDTAVLQLEAGQKVYSVTLARSEIADAVDADYRGFAKLVGSLKRTGEQTALVLSHRAAALPGLRERLAEVGGTRVVPLPDGVAAAGALRMRERIRSHGESLPFITRLSAGPAQPAGAPPSAAVPARTAAGTAPTHVLHGGDAYPITEEPFVLGIAVPVGRRGVNLRGQTAGISRAHCSIRRDGDRVIVEDHSTHGSFLNGQRLDGRAELAAGDGLRLGSPGIELLLVRVVDEGGVGGEKG